MVCSGGPCGGAQLHRPVLGNRRDDHWVPGPGATPPCIDYHSTCPPDGKAEVSISLMGSGTLEQEAYDVPSGQIVTVVGHTLHVPAIATKRGR